MVPKSDPSKSTKTVAGEARPVMLALQGGGAHGAFSWGVLDQLLLDNRIRIEAISATSGGALLAVIMADGLLRGGAEEARTALLAFWKKLSLAATLLPLRVNMVDKMLSNVGIDFSPSSVALDYLTRMFSPYQFNLFDLNPIRSIVEEMVDFDLLRANKELKLFINATEVKSGKLRVFETGEVSLDAVMAAACLPFIFKTVEVEGTAFWDGGYVGNPVLYPLARHMPCDDILLVQNTPISVEEVPVRAADIMDRVTEISFNTSLMHELRNIYYHNDLIAKGIIKDPAYRTLHIHLIEAQDLLSGLGRASKLNADWDFLVHLHDIGVQTATDWLESHATKLGKASSVDLERLVF